MKAFAWILSVLYIAAAVFVWMCPVKGYCPEGAYEKYIPRLNLEKPEEAANLPEVSSLMNLGAVTFSRGSAEPLPDSLFLTHIEQVAGVLESDKDLILGVEGLYSVNEPYEGKLANLGIARAQAFSRLLISRGMDSSRMVIFFGLLPDSVSRGDSALVNPVSLVTLTPDVSWLTSAKEAAVFRFMGRSQHLNLTESNRLFLVQLLACLQTKRVSNVLLTGHTSSQGTSSDNQILGEEKAQSLKAMLLQCGADNVQIQTASRGEEDSIKKPESTEADRRTNRRIVVSFP